jgi:hypothetical protein
MSDLLGKLGRKPKNANIAAKAFWGVLLLLVVSTLALVFIASLRSSSPESAITLQGSAASSIDAAEPEVVEVPRGLLERFMQEAAVCAVGRSARIRSIWRLPAAVPGDR